MTPRIELNKQFPKTTATENQPSVKSLAQMGREKKILHDGRRHSGKWWKEGYSCEGGVAEINYAEALH